MPRPLKPITKTRLHAIARERGHEISRFGHVYFTGKQTGKQYRIQIKKRVYHVQVGLNLSAGIRWFTHATGKLIQDI